MIAFIVKRLLHGIPMIFGVVVIVFLLLRLTPNDPIQTIVGPYPVSESVRQSLEAEYGLDGSLLTQFIRFITQAAQGNLGYSPAYQTDVTSLILSRLPATLQIISIGFILGTTVGILVGAFMALSRRRTLASGMNLGFLVVYSIPLFWVGQLLVLIFSVVLGWLPTQGSGPIVGSDTAAGRFVESLPYMVLPIMVYALHEGARAGRMSRATVLEVATQPYIATAQMKGLGASTIVRRHVMRNAILPVVTSAGYNLGIAIAGSVLVETVFAWPGVGLLLIQSINSGDNQVVTGITLFIGCSVVALNMIVDILYAILDPRTRISRGGAR